MQYLRNTQFYKNLNGSRKRFYIYFVLLILWMASGESKHLEVSTRSKGQVEGQHCISYGCTQQGSFCKEVDGVHTCVCNRDCIQPNQNERICASNNQTYSSTCVMNRVACENGTSIRKIKCPTTIPPKTDKIPVNLCKLPPVRGTCGNLSMRLYFNPNTGRCQEFVYYGCGGNANNFPHITACEDTCSSGVAYSKPSHFCPFCSQNVAKSYCHHAFVVTARVKRISQLRLLQLQITRVLKDENDVLGLRYLNLSVPTEASNNFLIDIARKCPCPDLKRVLHSSNRHSTGWNHEHNCDNSHSSLSTGQKTSTSRRKDRCTELILSGNLVYGMPTIAQGESLAVKATTTNLKKIKAIADQPYLCAVIDQVEREAPTMPNHTL